jgi:hypothetical protein
VQGQHTTTGVHLSTNNSTIPPYKTRLSWLRPAPVFTVFHFTSISLLEKSFSTLFLSVSECFLTARSASHP